MPDRLPPDPYAPGPRYAIRFDPARREYAVLDNGRPLCYAPSESDAVCIANALADWRKVIGLIAVFGNLVLEPLRQPGVN